MTQMDDNIERICAAAIMCYREGLPADEILAAVVKKLKSGEPLSIEEATAQSDLEEWLYATLAEIAKVDVCFIKSSSRSRPLPQLRYMLCDVFHDMGFTVNQISGIVGIDRCTVLHGLRQMESYRFGGYDKENEIYMEFRKRAAQHITTIN